MTNLTQNQTGMTTPVQQTAPTTIGSSQLTSQPGIQNHTSTSTASITPQNGESHLDFRLANFMLNRIAGKVLANVMIL